MVKKAATANSIRASSNIERKIRDGGVGNMTVVASGNGRGCRGSKERNRENER